MTARQLLKALLLLSIGFAGSLSKSQVQASPHPLFHRGAETFNMKDGQSRTPTFRILNDSIAKKTVAVALNSSLKLSGPQASNTQQFVDLRFEKVTLKPVATNSSLVTLVLTVSGREYELEPTLRKADLASGKVIRVQIPPKENDVALFKVSTKGQFALKYNAGEQVLLVSNALAHITIENPVFDDESEQIQFVGKGIRQ